MGLLDDAIREHLELKRRHGASSEDVDRQEREALGAARREPPAAPAGEEPLVPAPEEPPPSPFDAEEAPPPREASADEPSAEEPEVAEEMRSEAPPVEEPPAEPEVPEPGREAGAPGYDEDPWLEEERDEVPADETLDRQAPEGDDVLEETPDFLQETPEHERLWFEQRPPRDFDWDK
jgi:hypothetical protein